jgi:hypothetical protein
MGHVFVSYARKDSQFVEMLHQKLKEANFDVWTDSVVRPGNDWRQDIDEAIRNAFAVLVIVTPAAKTSEYVTYEWAYALGLGIKVIPIILKSTPLHPRLEFLQHIEFTAKRGDDYPWDRLVEGLLHVKQDTRSPTLPARTAPFLPDFGTARMNAPGVWVIVQRGPQPEQMWNLNKDVVSIGREITNDIVINDQQVSRRHARFIRKTQGAFPTFDIEDLQSSNGTFINNSKLTGSIGLKHGDMIQLGDTVVLAYTIITEDKREKSEHRGEP